MKTKLNDIILVKTAFERESVLEFEDNFELSTDINIPSLREKYKDTKRVLIRHE